MNHGDFDSVLTQQRFIRRLARDLLGNGDGVDDLEQEVYCRALQYPPDMNQPLRPWLATVMRRIVQRRWQREGYRRFSEERSARNRLVDLWPAEENPGGEVVRRAVHRLDPESQQLLADIYGADLSMSELAKRKSMPPETLRSRHHRVIVRLRGMLDDEQGGKRRSWALLLEPLLKVTRSSNRWQGRMVAACACSLLVIGLAVGLGWVTSMEPSGALRRATSPLASVDLAERSQVSSRIPSTLQPNDRPQLSMGEAAALDAIPLEILVTDDFGTPVPGALLFATLPESSPEEWDRIGQSNYHGFASVDSYPSRGWIWAQAPDGRQSHAVHLRRVGARTALRPLELAVERTNHHLVGRVIDGDGKPLSGVRVILPFSWGRTRRTMSGHLICPSPLRTVTTAADGRFEFREIVKRPQWEVGLRHPELGHMRTALQAGVSGGVDLPFLAPVQVSGRILGLDGQPIVGAEVGLRYRGAQDGGSWEAVSTGANGGFLLDRVPRGDYLVEVRKGQLAQCAAVEVVGQDLYVGDLRLAVRSGLYGRVLGPEGAPLVGWHVWHRSPFLVGSSADAIEGLRQLDVPHAKTDEEGRFAFGSRATGRRILWVTPPGQATPYAAAAEVLEVTSRPLGEPSEPVILRVGALERPSGAIEGTIAIDPQVTEGWVVACSGSRLFQPRFAVWEPETGRFRFEALPAGHYQVQIAPRASTGWVPDFEEHGIEVVQGRTSTVPTNGMRASPSLVLTVDRSDGVRVEGLRRAVLYLEGRRALDLLREGVGEWTPGKLVLGKAPAGQGILWLRDLGGHGAFLPYSIEGQGVVTQSLELKEIDPWVLKVPLTLEQRNAGTLRISVHDAQGSTVGIYANARRGTRNEARSVRAYTEPGLHEIRIRHDGETEVREVLLEARDSVSLPGEDAQPTRGRARRASRKRPR